jgi:hypothetical protein
LPSKQTSARGGKAYPYNGFLNFFFYFFLRILAIDIVILIDVIDLGHQIIELGKDRDDGYCKMLIWNFKLKLERWGERNLFLPSPSQRTSFPVAIPSIVQNKTKPFTAELTISGQYLR